MSTRSRLSKLYREAERIEIHNHSKIVLMSDCHRGTGTNSDNFLKNSPLVFAALTFYHQRQFSYIELGDGDELWENRKPENIIQTHSNVFWLLSEFYCQGRYKMLYGNHDKKKQNRFFLKRHYEEYYCDSEDCSFKLFPDIQVAEALVLKDCGSNREIMLAHGHQGDLVNDVFWRFSRFLVRFLWKRLELIGVLDPTSTAKNYKKKKKTERKLETWANKHGVMLIAGHTHRPVLPKPGKSLYLNDGSCVHPRCITALEIENGMITLVKWCTMTNQSRGLYVGREVLEGPHKIKDYFA